MNLEEYRQELIEQIKISADYEMNTVQNEFVDNITNILIEAEEFDDFEQGYFEGISERNKRMRIDGCYFDEFDKTFVILLSDFSGSSDIKTITTTEINKLYDNMKNFVEASIKGYIRQKGFEESSAGYEFARKIESKFNEIIKFRFYIITDKILSDRVKNLKKDNISGIATELNVWDINRLYSIFKSTLGKESIEINFNEINYNGIPCVKAVEFENEYSSYLAVIPGNILANLYIKYGSRLLEGNVRSFLSNKGKVNKNIRNTIINNPTMFFAYNNGIAATATDIKTKTLNDTIYITNITDLQIINGGQTTASIANTMIQDKCDLSKIYVPMKISVVEHNKSVEMIPIIARCANSQNKIDEADFFSNSPYHIRIEEYSRKIYAPAINGNQYQTIWFYERARGQYNQAQMKMTKTERKKFQLKNPKNQLIKKVDLAKYINTYRCVPHIVSRGAQANMRYFADITEREWKISEQKFNENYYKKIISLAIIFKRTENLISNQEWYKQIKAYRANIVTYSIAIIFYILNKNYPEKEVDFKKIWNIQNIYPEFESQLIETTLEIFKFITRDDRTTLNVTEWCKKEECWKRATELKLELKKEFIETLVNKENENTDLKNNGNNELENEIIKLGENYWKKLLEKSKKGNLVTPIEEEILERAIKYCQKNEIPSNKQTKSIIEVKEKLSREG